MTHKATSDAIPASGSTVVTVCGLTKDELAAQAGDGITQDDGAVDCPDCQP